MTKLSVIQDVATDADNWYNAVNTCTYKSNWKLRAKPEDKPMVEAISWKTKEEAFDLLFPYLEEKYENNKELITKKKQEAEEILGQYKDEIFTRMANLTKHPVAYDEIKLFITTYPRCPYNWEKWYIRLAINISKEQMLNILAHEVIHFQFHKYYSSHPKVKLLNFEQFDTLKESLSFLLNHEFPGIPMTYDYWYEAHQDFRKQLENYRLSLKEKDFDLLVTYWCDLLLSAK